MRFNSKTIAFFGVSVALLFAVLLVETFVFKLFLPITPAIISLPLAFSLSMFKPKKTAFFGGTALGVCSFVLSFIAGVPPFMNPLISVLPRILCGAASAGIYALCLKFLSDKKYGLRVAASIGGAAGVLLNTVTVVFMLFVFEYGTISAVLTTVLSFNFLFEFLSGIILCPVLVPVMNKFAKLDEGEKNDDNTKRSGEKEDTNKNESDKDKKYKI